MLGRRRVGKTALLMKSDDGGKLLYLFVSRNSEAVRRGFAAFVCDYGRRTQICVIVDG
jgi:AAA+ ATPase superfamily predicted ATPase